MAPSGNLAAIENPNDFAVESTHLQVISPFHFFHYRR
jgi:hypothetical protein